MKVLVLVTDAFGGRGGIAQYNRNLLTAIANHPLCTRVLALPRVICESVPALPPGVDFDTDAAQGKAQYFLRLVRAITAEKFDTVICGHLNLLPLAKLAAHHQSIPLLQIIYGIEAWEAPKSRLRRRMVRSITTVASISQFTARRFQRWSDIDERRVRLLPCCVELSDFGPGPKRVDLLDTHDLHGRTVLLTLARLADDERYKGFDEVIEALPTLARAFPSICYLIVGEGPDRVRLEAKASAMGVGHLVTFAGYIREEDKADYYRLADAFVMPGRGEGFGIVYVEAMACGIPVVASAADASREVVRDGALGEVVDPDNAEDVISGIKRALASGRREPNAALASYSVSAFEERCHLLLDQIIEGRECTVSVAASAQFVSDASDALC